MLSINPLLLFVLWQATAPAASELQSLSATDTFEKAQISKAAQAQIADALEANSVDWDRGRITQLRARRVSLTPGKKDGLMVLSTASADCGATGNCFFAILRQEGGSWRVVLQDAVIDGFAVSKELHHGLYDVKLSANQSAETSVISVMAFNGTEYHASRCFLVTEKSGSKRITPIACPAENSQ